MSSALLLTGVGLRSAHYADFLNSRPGVAWLEVHSENYFGDGGKPLSYLEKIAQHYPISLHGVSLSLGSSDELNWQHLVKLRNLIARINPCLISEHLSWSSINGQYFHDLLPLPYTEESLNHIVARIQQVQDYLKRQILIENISSYITYSHSTIPEHEFFNAVATQSGCGILLDINNIYISATNLNFDPLEYISAMKADHVQEFHLAGFTSTNSTGHPVLVDTHNTRVANEVWELYRHVIKKLGRKPTIIEWDSDLPALDLLLSEANYAETIMRETYAATKLTG